MLNLVLAAIKNKEEINQRENFLHSIGSFVARVFLGKEMETLCTHGRRKNKHLPLSVREKNISY